MKQLPFKKYLYPQQSLSSQRGLLISGSFPNGNHPHEKTRVLVAGRDELEK